MCCRSCRRLRSFDLASENQKIAACGSSYRRPFTSMKNPETKKPRTINRPGAFSHLQPDYFFRP
ncbi:hypothetical protein C9422_15165 [Pseudomonas sp. B1(2018)]|nr:hypothetical protein C9422_15165 [Pseudomonas sp. B1(2018)]